MTNKIKYLIFGIIILIAVFLRFYQLGTVPASPDWDEAALGYNAYSILTTGKDEFGKVLPVVLKSFGDYKPALYAYLAIPSVAVFGLNTFAVRLPSALFGVLSVILTYFLVYELFDDKKYKEQVALASSFFLAISPWAIQFSRTAFEANVGVTFNILTALFFLKGLKKPWMLSLSAIFAALAIYTYQSEKVFVPLFAAILVAIYARDLVKIRLKYLISAAVFGVILILPMVLFILGNPQALARAQGTSLFANQTVVLKSDVARLAVDDKKNDVVGKVFDNRRVTYAISVLGGYLSHFDPNWLFITGDNTRHHAPGMGLLYLFEIPLLLIGMYMLLFGDFEKKTKLLIFLWFLAAPIPASITNDVPHAVRTINFLPTFQIFLGVGLVYGFLFISNIKYQILKINIKNLIFGFCVLFFIFNFLYYLNQYFVQLNYFDAFSWQYGYEQVVNKVANLAPRDSVIVSSNQPLDKSYMFFLYYTKFDPSKYQQIQNSDSIHQFGRYAFRPIDSSFLKLNNTILVTGPDDLPSVAPTYPIYNPDGTLAFKIIVLK